MSDDEAARALRGVLDAATGRAAGPERWTLRARSGDAFDPARERELRLALALARPSARDAARGAPARLSATKGDVELSLVWPVDGERGDRELAVRAPVRTPEDAMQWLELLAAHIDPECVRIAPLLEGSRAPAALWAVGSVARALDRLPPRAARARVGRIDLAVAHPGAPASDAWEDREARDALSRWWTSPHAEPAPSPEPRPTPPVTAPARVPAASPSPSPVGEGTLALDESGGVGASETGFREALTTVPLPRISLEQYAALHAELRLKGGALTPNLGRRYGVASDAVYRALVQRFRESFAADPALAARFVALVQEFTRTFGA